MIVFGFRATALMSGRTGIYTSAGHSRENLEYAIEKPEEVADKCLLCYSRSAMGIYNDVIVGRWPTVFVLLNFFIRDSPLFFFVFPLFSWGYKYLL